MEQASADTMEVVTEEITTETVLKMEPESEIVTETVDTMQANQSAYTLTGPTELAVNTAVSTYNTNTPTSYIESVPTTFTESTSTSYIESVPSTFVESTPSTYNDSAMFTESAQGTYMEMAQSNLNEGTQPAYIGSVPQTYNDGRLDSMTPSYTESRLEEAELIINLSSRSRRSLSNPTLTQVNTSIAGSENFTPSLPDSGTNISISETFVNPIQSLGDSSASIEMQTDGEVVDTVSVSEHDPLLEENTVAIMGQVTSSHSGLMSESSETSSVRNEEHVSTDEVNPNNVIVISMIDEDDQSKKKSPGRGKLAGTTEGEQTPQAIYIGDSSESQAPVPTGLVVNQAQLKEPDQPEITIVRKKVHQCIVCNAEFKCIMDLFRHRVEHNESMKTEFKCQVTPNCKLTFEDPMELEKHKLTHSEQRVYKCSICQDTFSLLHNYKCHLRIHKNQGPYVCNMCYRVFDKKAQFISHMDDHEFASMNPYRHRLQCSICDKIFSDSAKLKRHTMTHSGKRDYKCTICMKEFFERHKLNRHMLSHTGKRDFQCTVCDKAFSLKHNLTIHMRIHENQRPYQCLVCKRTFIQKIVLQRHLRIHQDYLMEQSQKFSQKYVN